MNTPIAPTKITSRPAPYKFALLILLTLSLLFSACESKKEKLTKNVLGKWNFQEAHKDGHDQTNTYKDYTLRFDGARFHLEGDSTAQGNPEFPEEGSYTFMDGKTIAFSFMMNLGLFSTAQSIEMEVLKTTETQLELAEAEEGYYFLLTKH